MTLKEQIQNAIKDELEKAFDLDDQTVVVNTPESKFGDYASPAAMGLAKGLKKNPREIAQVLAENLSKNPLFSEVTIAGPGFLNFRLSDAVLDGALNSIATNFEWGRNDSRRGEKLLLEYVSANPTGPLHIGHGRWAAIGDSMARILRFSGADVHTEFYINDAGNQIKKLNESVFAAKEGREIPEDGYHGDYIKEIADQADEKTPAKDILLSMQKATLNEFRSEFDRWFSELTLHKNGKVEEAIQDLTKKGFTYEEEGALWFRTTDFGDDKDRVLIKADGAYTYFAVDIAYHRDKVQRGYSELINVFGADHHGYIARLNAAVNALGDGETKLNIIIGQLVNLFRDGEPVRMSKRTGDMIGLREVFEEIGVDATRYFLVMRKTDSGLDFDLEEAKKKSDDNPVFYIQYASARLSGVLRKAEEEGIDTTSMASKIVDSDEARDVALDLIRFPEVLSDIAKTLEPHRIHEYLTTLAGDFHRFYHHHRILGEAPEVTARRLVILRGVRQVLQNGLSLIGVSAPEKM